MFGAKFDFYTKLYIKSAVIRRKRIGMCSSVLSKVVMNYSIGEGSEKDGGSRRQFVGGSTYGCGKGGGGVSILVIAIHAMRRSRVRVCPVVCDLPVGVH